MDVPEAPSGLGEAGRALWVEILSEYELAPDERMLLVQACRTVDELEMLADALVDGAVVVHGSTGQPKASGLFAEARAHRVVLAKLLEQLALPADGDEEGKSPAQLRAQKAAQARWALQRARSGTA
ncbi:hypothetical protein OOK13_39155 [Streptomyces sp. NBC_00378]|uniref:hypothetical protein n=1 Tax=unclassified Streptomyces TaxID=2593676 RepID=UPI00225392E9|nr:MULTISPECIES: hypothetical protein [unclassified Streptomyces]MCX5114378.1 hypothetical protein [Streptomyces sp. NBC_00378]